jgi:hypothetical protein
VFDVSSVSDVLCGTFCGMDAGWRGMKKAPAGEVPAGAE